MLNVVTKFWMSKIVEKVAQGKGGLGKGGEQLILSFREGDLSQMMGNCQIEI